MADPLTIGLGIGALVGGGTAIASGAFSGGGGDSAPAQQAAVAPPDPSTPATTPNAKPAKKQSMNQSFLSGAAQLQRDQGAASSGAGGKTLLGQ